jgi:hypothetical protein
MKIMQSTRNLLVTDEAHKEKSLYTLKVTSVAPI